MAHQWVFFYYYTANLWDNHICLESWNEWLQLHQFTVRHGVHWLRVVCWLVGWPRGAWWVFLHMTGALDIVGYVVFQDRCPRYSWLCNIPKSGRNSNACQMLVHVWHCTNCWVVEFRTWAFQSEQYVKSLPLCVKQWLSYGCCLIIDPKNNAHYLPHLSALGNTLVFQKLSLHLHSNKMAKQEVSTSPSNLSVVTCGRWQLLA